MPDNINKKLEKSCPLCSIKIKLLEVKKQSCLKKLLFLMSLCQRRNGRILRKPKPFPFFTGLCKRENISNKVTEHKTTVSPLKRGTSDIDDYIFLDSLQLGSFHRLPAEKNITKRLGRQEESLDSAFQCFCCLYYRTILYIVYIMQGSRMREEIRAKETAHLCT